MANGGRNEGFVVRADDGTRVAYDLSGSGPPLVLINGLTTTSFFWRYLRPAWERRHTVLTWDYPGHGRSDAAQSERSSTLAAQAELLARVMDHAGLREATLVGFSVGCQVMFEFAHRYSERCTALVSLFGSFERALSSTSLPVPGMLLHALLASSGAATWARLMQRSAARANAPLGLALIRRLNVVGPRTTAEHVRQIVHDLQRVDAKTCSALARSAEAHSARPYLARLAKPLLILTGTRDRFAPPHKVAEPLHRLVPHSVLVRVEGATHTALLDEPERIASEVDAFLRKGG